MIRRLQLVLAGGVLVIGAFSTGLELLFYLLYLGLLVGGGAYVVTRLGLTDLEAGYALSRTHGHVGDQLRATYTVRNVGRLPKLWLEVHSPSTLPVTLPGRALSLGPRGRRSWMTSVSLQRRGHYRVDALAIRTGDPFGLFEAAATVGRGATVVVYPRVDPLPRWRAPAATLEGTRGHRERTQQTTALVTTVRPYRPGDAYNRIAWKTTARHGEIQVKEFELEQTADIWVFLDLERALQAGRGERSTVEVGVRVAASIAFKALAENRAVGLTVSAHRVATLPADRGPRQYQRIMELLAAVEGDGVTPLAEVLLLGASHLRRGVAAIVVTPSLDTTWVRPLGALRPRGVACQVIRLDTPAFEADARASDADGGPGEGATAERQRAARLVVHALSEFDIPVLTVRPESRLSEALATTGPGRRPRTLLPGVTR